MSDICSWLSLVRFSPAVAMPIIELFSVEYVLANVVGLVCGIKLLLGRGSLTNK